MTRRTWDLRTGRETHAALGRDWRQAARAARGALAKADARHAEVVETSRALWRMSRALRRTR